MLAIKTIKDESIPVDISKYTLLVEKFETKDVYKLELAGDTVAGLLKCGNSTGNSSDNASNTWVNPNYAYQTPDPNSNRSGRANPLIKYTNNHLTKRNRKLSRIFSNCKQVNQVVSSGDIAKFESQKYRYVLKRFPYYRSYVTPKGGGSYYTYVYYIYDKVANKNSPAMCIYSGLPWKTLRVIKNKLNLENVE